MRKTLALLLALTAGSAQAYQPEAGLWWNPNESGWGIHFTQRGNVIFAAWYTYDGTGAPKWYVASYPPNRTRPSGVRR